MMTQYIFNSFYKQFGYIQFLLLSYFLFGGSKSCNWTLALAESEVLGISRSGVKGGSVQRLSTRFVLVCSVISLPVIYGAPASPLLLDLDKYLFKVEEDRHASFPTRATKVSLRFSHDEPVYLLRRGRQNSKKISRRFRPKVKKTVKKIVQAN